MKTRIDAFWNNPLKFAHNHLASVPRSISEKVGPPGHMRGVDFYEKGYLVRVYAKALSNFLDYHGHFPNIDPPLMSFEHMFLSKFFRYFPVDPNPAAKHNSIRYLSESLRPLIKFPSQVVVDTPSDLFRIKEFPSESFFIKPALGNSDLFKTDIEGLVSNRAKILRVLNSRYRQRYGVSWGEWLYGLGNQRIVVEEDLSAILTGFEYQFYTRDGKVRMFRKSANLNKKHIDMSAIRQSYFYPDGSYCKGTLKSKGEVSDLELPDTVELMTRIATDIGSKFDAIRIDFFETREGIALGELSCFPGNARFKTTTPELEALYLDAISMTSGDQAST